jgi:serine/threonine protein kinase
VDARRQPRDLQLVRRRSQRGGSIAQVHGFEVAGGTPALVMEIVEGEDLADRIRRGPVPIEDAVAIARQVAAALEAAHESLIVHRDLKPANIKVRPDGTVKVLDFGLAKALDPVGAGHAPAAATFVEAATITTPAMTRAGIILGTAAYMAPEQAKGKPLDRRADIWAFGVVLYEMLTGRAAFDGETVTEVLAAVITQDADLSRLPPETPPALRQLLARCLQKDPRVRLRDIGEARPSSIEAGAIAGGAGARRGGGFRNEANQGRSRSRHLLPHRAQCRYTRATREYRTRHQSRPLRDRRPPRRRRHGRGLARARRAPRP